MGAPNKAKGLIFRGKVFLVKYKMAALDVYQVETGAHFLEFMPSSNQQIHNFWSKTIPKGLIVIKISFQAVFQG